MRRDGKPIAGTLVVPAGASERLPGWIAVGGVSRKGRFHPQLMRFVEALASSGAAVVVPEIPEWRRLRVSPRVTLPTIRGAVEFMNGRSEVVPEQYGVIGFSFGAPGVAIAASHEDVADQMAGIVLFGGYCSLERTLGCQLTGRHEWRGVDYRLSPDPYGRWVVASNYLQHIPGCEDAEDVVRALRRLAAAASGQRISAWEPHHDRMISEVRNDISCRRQKLFDCLATPTTSVAPEEGAAPGAGRAPPPRPGADTGHPWTRRSRGAVHGGSAAHGRAAYQRSAWYDGDAHDQPQQGLRSGLAR